MNNILYYDLFYEITCYLKSQNIFKLFSINAEYIKYRNKKNNRIKINKHTCYNKIKNIAYSDMFINKYYLYDIILDFFQVCLIKK